MPTYEYICRGCNARFSLFLPVSQREDALCPECSSGEVQLIPSWQGGITGGPGSGRGGSEPPASGPDIGPCGSCCGETCPFDD